MLCATAPVRAARDRKSTRLNSSHSQSSYAVFCSKKRLGRLRGGVAQVDTHELRPVAQLLGSRDDAWHLRAARLVSGDPAPADLCSLSLHDALPISSYRSPLTGGALDALRDRAGPRRTRSEEHTSELQSQSKLVCRLLLEKTPGPSPRRSRAS